MTFRTWGLLIGVAVAATVAAFLGPWVALGTAVGLPPLLYLGWVRLAHRRALEDVRQDALAHWPPGYRLPRELRRVQQRQSREADEPEAMPLLEPFAECPGCERTVAPAALLVEGGNRWRYQCLECSYLWPLT